MIGGLIIVLGIVSMVMIHEAGHFFAAKAVGMKATEFFFGFGPRLWSTRRGETEYGVKAIPAGGYVRIVGMNPYEEVAPEDEGHTYRDKPFWAKSVVVLAGVASHFVVAYLLFLVVLVGIGLERFSTTTTVGAVQEQMEDGSPTPAALAGLRPGDQILALGGAATGDWEALVEAISAHPGETVTLSVEREGSVIAVEATIATRADTGRGYLGVQRSVWRERVGPLAGLGRAASTVGDAVVLSAQGLWGLVTGLPDLLAATLSGSVDAGDPNRPASPIGLVRVSQDLGVSFTLQLVAYVNVFVGILNAIPLYPLDGGHFAVALYEKVRGRRADVRKLAPVAAAVVVFLIVIGVLALYLDIAAPFRLQ